jgi:pimeloyl-ACP methyl ester carboxylesterase
MGRCATIAIGKCNWAFLARRIASSPCACGTATPSDGTGSAPATSRQSTSPTWGAFIAALGTVPVHPLGHSRGGSVAFGVARQWPHQLRSLILADPGGQLEDSLAGGDAPPAALSPSCAIAPSASGGATSVARSAASAMPSAALRLGQGARDRQGDNARQRPNSPRSSERAPSALSIRAQRCERSGRRRC